MRFCGIVGSVVMCHPAGSPGQVAGEQPLAAFHGAFVVVSLSQQCELWWAERQLRVHC